MHLGNIRTKRIVMQYKVGNQRINSENSAKPIGTASSYLVNLLRNRDYTNSALDYGCGKLRYTNYLASRSKKIGIVDSKVQLERMQKIGGEFTSVIQHFQARWPRAIIQNIADFWEQPSQKYGFILCANVLSAIPCPRIRAKSLLAIKNALEESGSALFVNQHTNSYFNKIRKDSGSRPHLDGWIRHSTSCASYYGILNRQSVIKLVKRYGFVVQDAWVKGQSNYIIAKRAAK